jgi:hypothetical protein
METQKRTKKELKSVIGNSILEAISNLQLPEPSKKIKKLVDRSSKKLAATFSDLLKREEKRKKKAEKLLKAAVNGTGKKKKKKLEAAEIDEPVKL